MTALRSIAAELEVSSSGCGWKAHIEPDTIVLAVYEEDPAALNRAINDLGATVDLDKWGWLCVGEGPFGWVIYHLERFEV